MKELPSLLSSPSQRPRLPKTGCAVHSGPREAYLAGSLECPQAEALKDRQLKQAFLAQTAKKLAPALRSPDQAVAFVHKFNGQLKLPVSVEKARDALMVTSAAKFLRVNPALFYEDLRGPYAAASQLLPRKSPVIMIAGDCHLGNLGTLRAPNGKVFWGINDYDMAGKGRAEWDLERLASSIALMGEEASLSAKDIAHLNRHMARAYGDELATIGAQGTSSLSGLKHSESYGPVRDLVEKASEQTQAHLLKRFADEGKGGFRLQRNHELKDVSPSEQKELSALLKDYDSKQGATPGLKRPLRILDIAHKLESGGSTFGLNRFYVLLEGEDRLPVILEMKQELPTAPESASGELTSADGSRIFRNMAALGGTADPMMAAANKKDGAYFLREREREKGALDPAALKFDDWKELVAQAGVALARAHAHQPGVAGELLKWIGHDQDTLEANLASFADSYAAQTRQDTLAYQNSLTA